MSESKQNTKRNLSKYCNYFSKLNFASTKKRGNAPYKPILLLSVIDLISQDIIQENKIPVSDELVETFNKYWQILSPNYKGGLHYPFFHLQNDGFWYLHLKQDFNGLQPRTTNKLKQAVEYASLDSELFDLLQDQITRQQLIDILISIWFSSSQKKLDDILLVNQGLQNLSIQEVEMLKISNSKTQSKRIYLRKSIVRNAFFRKAIIHVYNYKCAFCGIKVTHSLTQNIVEGAHIKPLAEFYDNEVDNGISLCKNHHWSFDNGLFTIDNNYKIVVASDFEEISPNSRLLKDFHGENINLPTEQNYFPRSESLQWHRDNVFKG